MIRATWSTYRVNNQVSNGTPGNLAPSLPIPCSWSWPTLASSCSTTSSSSWSDSGFWSHNAGILCWPLLWAEVVGLLHVAPYAELSGRSCVLRLDKEPRVLTISIKLKVWVTKHNTTKYKTISGIKKQESLPKVAYI